MVFLDLIILTRAITVHRAGSQLKIKRVQVDPRDMLNNFCFHVYAQKSLFIGENGNGFFLPPHHPILLVCQS